MHRLGPRTIRPLLRGSKAGLVNVVIAQGFHLAPSRTIHRSHKKQMSHTGNSVDLVDTEAEAVKGGIEIAPR